MDLKSIFDYYKDLNVNTKIIHIFICIGVLYFCINIINTNLGHILAFFIILVVVMSIYTIDTSQSITINTEIQAKLDSLLDFSDISQLTCSSTGSGVVSEFIRLDPYGYNYPPKFMYTDANLIELFFDIKNTFYIYNPEAYLKSLLAANNLLEIRNNFELQLLPPVTVPNLQDNYSKDLKLQHAVSSDTKMSDGDLLINAYPEYTIAESEFRNSLNHLQSFITNIPSEPVFHLKHRDILTKAEILLKRNLDKIYKIYKNKKSKNDSIITDYDNTQPYNKFKDTTTFTFY